MSVGTALLPPAVSLLASLFVTAFLTRSRAVLDHPNERSLHHTPVPRTGGVGIASGLLLGVAFAPALGLPLAIWLGTAILFALSLLDDYTGLPVWARFGTHAIAAAIVLMPLGPTLGWAVLGIGVVAVVWMTNLYNFMDGSDGLAGGMTLFGFGFLGVAAWTNGAFEMAIVSACLAAAALAFLVFNFFPARIFMGDAGAIPIGFLAACIGLYGVAAGLWPIWFPVLVFSAFIVDASVTLARRLLRHERIWRAHREHYYQRLIRMGFGHRKTALLEYAVMLVSGVTAILVLHARPAVQIAVLALCGVAYVTLIAWIEFGWRRFEAAISSVRGN